MPGPHSTSLTPRSALAVALSLAAWVLVAPGCEPRSAKSSTSTTAGSSGSSGSGAGTGEADCFSAFDPAACAALGDACYFEPAGYFEWGGGPSCTRVEGVEFGWCFPAEHGGSGAPEAFWEPATGRVASFSYGWTQTPPGWETCTGEAGQPPCCKCLNFMVPPECEQNDSIGGSGGGTSTGTGG